jgi:phenylacetic acid degradation operon negative regulatory protein
VSTVVAESVGPPRLPRPQVGSSPQHLLSTLLGDFWIARTEHLPMGVLIHLLGIFGVGATNARAAVQRLARRGVIVSSRRGRNSSFGFAPGMADAFAAGAHGIIAFGRTEEVWDGRWTLALFTLSERRRETRHVVYSQLRRLGFTPYYDGVWVSARDVTAEATNLFATLGLGDATVLRVDDDAVALRNPRTVWNLDQPAARYRSFIATHGPVRDQLGHGEFTPARALVARVRLMDDWRQIPDLDPRLPAALLPPDWPRRAAFDLFAEVFDALGPPAAARVRQVVAAEDPQLAPLVTHTTTAQLLELGRRALAARSHVEGTR